MNGTEKTLRDPEVCTEATYETLISSGVSTKGTEGTEEALRKPGVDTEGTSKTLKNPEVILDRGNNLNYVIKIK